MYVITIHRRYRRADRQTNRRYRYTITRSA